MIHIFYRHTNSTKLGSYRPNWFSYNKCFINLLKTIAFHRDIVKLNVVFDGDITKNSIYTFSNLFNTIEINAGSDIGSWNETNQIIKHQCEDNIIKENDLIYFLENDYLHVQGWVIKVIELFRTHKDKYISLYDHADKYFDYDKLESKIIATSNCHWRTTPSTCGSYIINREVFLEDFEDIETINRMCYDMGPTPDHYKFLTLNLYKKRQVLTPIPGLSTHVMNGLMSPTIDWETINSLSYEHIGLN